jgi:hypothetical protein
MVTVLITAIVMSLIPMIDRYLNGKGVDIAYVTAKVYHMKIEPTIHPQGVSSSII